MSYIEFTPIYQERVWGGRGLADLLGREIPEGKVIGESWEIVDRPEAQSTVGNGKFKGLTIRQLIEENTDSVMGPNYDASRPFPILVKWLDCQDRLSLQVHPPADIAPELNGEPKTENWYVAKCRPGSHLIAGLKKGVSREEFEQALKDGDLEDKSHRFPVDEGASLLVESGRFHAIDGGNLILEIQQNSDTTYRVYDWGRVGLDGKPRDLHIEESLKSIDFNDFEPEPLRTKGSKGEIVLADCKEFRIRKRTLQAGESLEFSANEEVALLHIVEGELVSNGASVPVSQNLLIPYAESVAFKAKNETVVLITDRFV